MADTLEIFGTEFQNVTGIVATDDNDQELTYIRPNMQAKTVTYTPTTSQQTESVTADSGYDGLSSVAVTVNAMPAGKNVQAYIGRDSRTANSYGATAVTLTVAKTGTYNVSWVAWRSSSSGTMGTNLHVNSTSGTDQQTFTSTYGQCITLTNQSYSAGDVLTIYATSGSNSRTINVANLVISEV